MYLDAMTNIHPVIVWLLKAHIHNIVDTHYQVYTTDNYSGSESNSDTNHIRHSSLDH
jgi:hypothetical protein